MCIRDSEDYFGALLHEVGIREERIRRLEHVVTYDALISDLYNEVVTDSELVRQRVGAQFGLVLVDEFQDTDGAQWKILESVFQGGPRVVPIVVVGDPKQAIYGFRGSDVHVFQRVAEENERDPHGLCLLYTSPS